MLVCVAPDGRVRSGTHGRGRLHAASAARRRRTRARSRRASRSRSCPGTQAVLLPDGTAAAPADAPPQVQNAVWAANTIQTLPYRYGGGHQSFISRRGYDCSGTVSFALGAAGLLKRPRDSSGFMRYGDKGPGAWFTVYTNPGHAYVVIAGLRLDTSSAGAGGGKGPRWRAKGRPTAGYTVRHPRGF